VGGAGIVRGSGKREAGRGKREEADALEDPDLSMSELILFK